jgi:hypothetical protein
MSKIYVTEDAIASVMVLDKRMETYPEPYRSRGTALEIVVSFEAYVKFITTYLDIEDYLATETVRLRYYYAHDNIVELRKCYYKDMAMAIMKELWYTGLDGQPTRLSHSIADSFSFPLEYVSVTAKAMAPQMSRASSSLLNYLSSVNYKIAPAKLVKFADEYNYATLLYAMASRNNEFGIQFQNWSLERSIS